MSFRDDDGFSEIFRLQPSIVLEEFETEAWVLNIKTGQSWLVNTTGYHILKLIDGYRTIDAIATEISNEFRDIESTNMRMDTQQFLEQLRGRGIIKQVIPKNGSKGESIMGDLENTKAFYIQNPDVGLREEGEAGALLFNPDTRQVKVLNATGLFLWKMCDGQTSVTNMIDNMQNEFEGATAEELSQDVLDFIATLEDAGFVGLVQS